MKKITQESLLEAKKVIDKAKTEISELTGEEKVLLKQLQERFGCKDLPSAKKQLIKLQDDIENIKKRENLKKEALKDDYELLTNKGG